MIEIGYINHEESEIIQKRAEIAKQLILKSENIKSQTVGKMTSADLKLLYELYDEVFFKGILEQSFKGNLKFSLSSLLSRSAAKTLCPRNIARLKPEQVTIEIRMGTHFFYKYNEIDNDKWVGGIMTQNSLEALQLVFEHELCHFIEFVNYHESSCRRKRFKNMAYLLFGHRESSHKLPTNREIVKAKYNLNIGDAVCFIFEKKEMTGIINNINKRATVMVKDKKGMYRDKKGNRYSKFYVPLTALKRYL